jgi:hypothetical protein
MNSGQFNPPAESRGDSNTVKSFGDRLGSSSDSAGRPGWLSVCPDGFSGIQEAGELGDITGLKLAQSMGAASHGAPNDAGWGKPPKRALVANEPRLPSIAPNVSEGASPADQARAARGGGSAVDELRTNPATGRTGPNGTLDVANARRPDGACGRDAWLTPVEVLDANLRSVHAN